MKLALYFIILIHQIVFDAHAKGTEPSITISSQITDTNVIIVKILNGSDSKIEIFNTNSSWFWSCLRFRCFDVSSGKYYFLNRCAAYSKNRPRMITLKPSEFKEIKIDTSDQTWPSIGRVEKKVNI